MAVADGGRAAARGDRLVKLIHSRGGARSQCSDTPVTEHQPGPRYLHIIYIIYVIIVYIYMTNYFYDNGFQPLPGFRGFLLDGCARSARLAAGRPSLPARRRFVTDTQDHFGPL